MNNILHIVDARISASDKDLPVRESKSLLSQHIYTVDALNPGQDDPSLGSSAQPKYFK